MQTDFSDVTELAGEPITVEQLYRLHHRYFWASQFSASRDVVECACGSGPGLGMLNKVAASFAAGDVSPTMVAIARRHYRERIPVSQFDAQKLPWDDRSRDVILLFEALYYIPDAQKFVEQCVRVLRPGGDLLIVTANKDLWDFHPSPHAHRYFGVVELRDLLSRAGFDCQFFGFQDIGRTTLRQRLLRPLKRLAVMSGLMPQTMAGKRWLKRLVFGAPVPMPAEVDAGLYEFVPPVPVPGDRPDVRHKIIYCAARLGPAGGSTSPKMREPS